MAKKKRSLENIHLEYDENGDWNQKRNRIKGALRQAFRLSPQMYEVMQRARIELSPALKKDGTPGKRPRVRYKCAICGELFPQKYVQVDHIDPVVPLNKTETDMSYDELAEGVFCKLDNLQVVCSTPIVKNNGKASCHKIKSDEENFIRKKLTEEINIKIKEMESEGLCYIREDLIDIDQKIKELKEEYKEYIIKREKKRIAKEDSKKLKRNKK